MSDKLRVLITAPPILPSVPEYLPLLAEVGVEGFVPDFDVIESLSEEELNRLLVDVDGILCGDDAISKAVLEKANKLKVVSKWGTGIDSIDSKAAAELGITVRRVEDAFANPVSDTVLTYILMFARQVIQKHQLVRDGDWRKVKSFSLSEQTLGVIGVGHIGKAVIERARAFGMKVYGCDTKSMSEDYIHHSGIEMVSREQLFSESDFISLNCDLNKTSQHILDADAFKQMKSTACVINTARGSLIDETALVEALQSGQIGGAGLDVFEVEPLPDDSPLCQMDNVWLSPHNSNASPSVFKRVDQVSINNLLSSLGCSEIDFATKG